MTLTGSTPAWRPGEDRRPSIPAQGTPRDSRPLSPRGAAVGWHPRRAQQGWTRGGKSATAMAQAGQAGHRPGPEAWWPEAPRPVGAGRLEAQARVRAGRGRGMARVAAPQPGGGVGGGGGGGRLRSRTSARAGVPARSPGAGPPKPHPAPLYPQLDVRYWMNILELGAEPQVLTLTLHFAFF